MNIDYFVAICNAIKRAIDKKLSEQPIDGLSRDIYAYSSIDGRRTTIEFLDGGQLITSVTLENKELRTSIGHIASYFLGTIA